MTQILSLIPKPTELKHSNVKYFAHGIKIRRYSVETSEVQTVRKIIEMQLSKTKRLSQ